MSDYPSRGGRPDSEAWRPQSRTQRPQPAAADYGSDGGDRYGASDGYGPRSRNAGGGAGASAGGGSRGRDSRDSRSDGYGDGYGDSGGGPRSGGSDGGGSRAAGRAVESGSDGMSRGSRLGAAFLCGAVPALVLAFSAGALASGGSAKSIAGISLNSKLMELTALGLVGGLALIAAALRWRKIEPLGLTWGYGLVAGLSWLGLLFMAQVKNVIPHLPPLMSVPLIAGAAFAAGAALTDESTSGTGRWGLLAAVLAAHIGIVAIVVTIVLA